jgi:hypothetical protein
MTGQAVLLFCSYLYSTAAHSRAASARPGGAALFCSYHYSTAAHSRAANARPGGAAFLQLPLLNSSSQQSSLCQAMRCCFFAAAITEQQLTAERPLPGQAVLLFCSYHYSTAAHSRATSARPGGASFLQLPLLNSSSQQSSHFQGRRCCFFSAAITQQQLTPEQPLPGQAVLLSCSCHYSIATPSRAASAKAGVAAFLQLLLFNNST